MPSIALSLISWVEAEGQPTLSSTAHFLFRQQPQEAATSWPHYKKCVPYRTYIPTRSTTLPAAPRLGLCSTTYIRTLQNTRVTQSGLFCFQEVRKGSRAHVHTFPAPDGPYCMDLVRARYSNYERRLRYLWNCYLAAAPLQGGHCWGSFQRLSEP